jgi:hypothetical protein
MFIRNQFKYPSLSEYFKLATVLLIDAIVFLQSERLLLMM